jgi:hypothetical protein
LDCNHLHWRRGIHIVFSREDSDEREVVATVPDETLSATVELSERSEPSDPILMVAESREDVCNEFTDLGVQVENHVRATSIQVHIEFP